ncbi:hypothetical protein BH24CHL8_BH24CHL8_06320 [soil metagenome]
MHEAEVIELVLGLLVVVALAVTMSSCGWKPEHSAT